VRLPVLVLLSVLGARGVSTPDDLELIAAVPGADAITRRHVANVLTLHGYEIEMEHVGGIGLFAERSRAERVRRALRYDSAALGYPLDLVEGEKVVRLRPAGAPFAVLPGISGPLDGPAVKKAIAGGGWLAMLLQHPSVTQRSPRTTVRRILLQRRRFLKEDFTLGTAYKVRLELRRHSASGDPDDMLLFEAFPEERRTL